MKARIALVVLILPACTAILVSASTGAADRPSRAASASKAPFVGTWRRLTTCGELVAALRNAGMGKWVSEFVAGNGFVPGVSSPDQILDAGAPCVGAIPRQHSHFFTKNGAFGSLDWKGQPVDDGRYKIMRRGTVVVFKEFPKVTFNYRIRGRALSLNPIVPKGCSSFRCAWAISVAYPGKTWQRVR